MRCYLQEKFLETGAFDRGVLAPAAGISVQDRGPVLAQVDGTGRPAQADLSGTWVSDEHVCLLGDYGLLLIGNNYLRLSPSEAGVRYRNCL